MQLQATDYLCWERASVVEQDQAQYWVSPTPVRDCLPQWFQQLPGNLKNLNLDSTIPGSDILINHGMRSAKLCLGLRGVRNLGWTIPLTQSYNQAGNSDIIAWKETHLHPAMLSGSGFDLQKSDGSYEWDIRLLSFPWRAKMSPGWRLLISAHPLSWTPDWFCFSGCVDANYRHDGHNIGSFWNFDMALDTDFNYYNIELVIAVRCTGKTIEIPAKTCIFSLVPIYDPEYQAPEFKEFPDFATLSHRS
jgi:hypothetical protein